MSLRVEPLDDRHDRTAFECGVEPLDRYLRLQAIQDGRRRIASSFVLVGWGTTPLAYYTLAAGSIALAALPNSLSKRLPRYPLLSATLLGRLAVDQRHSGHGFGEQMLMDAFARALRSEIATYAIVVDATDEQTATFYRLHNFLPLTASGDRLFLPMAEIARLFA
ncbi:MULTISPECIES: GNAT family N-acetyltransferase [unclassified Mesorhizobium]|uniref:GNAT family N-acetyltransferase n=1 Tax=unclassified Mesorhizobium TaxID=325217 RepID=UPI000FCB4BAD|nr:MULTISPECIES: GNAT family N-acetyltransferase [unclassified Mesorhizobium]RUV63535.1 GNAT family N-acetyltransferase [Mesorhizobium sp. M5C.F.Ca.IN.020.29.1.1]RWA97073.1 MAG: GNAT family N-acetyltransferase [Mesorhizobium sp.]RWC10957.1 MAG: GNAT family N-acetyltransferase [Mesorhizobium sp.]RWD76414.1 MAG: GNAT family N-acetyltransferase [Mesorhizobium sp.]RWE52859.1 MAG: GNAT family N-acetyltransferase [Mesorhizobium sp.]